MAKSKEITKMSTSEVGEQLKFASLHSAVDEGFWHTLSSLKLNKLGIDESPIPLTGFYAPCSHHKISNPVTLLSESLPPGVGDHSSISATNHGNRNRCPIPGIIFNTNTLEGFHALDRGSLLKAEANKVWDDIHSGKVEENSSLLLRFLVISFAELKKWSFHYWFAFPALHLDPPARLISLRSALECLSSEEVKSLQTACNEWRGESSTTGVPFFLVCIASNSQVTIRPLSFWGVSQKEGYKVIFGFYDPCHLPRNPGWPLRNFLIYICARLGLKKVQFLCYREARGLADLKASLIGEVFVSVSQGWKDPQTVPVASGWELNKGLSVPRCISLFTTMDPTSLAISAADLNLKLMKWRALPSLMLDSLTSSRCLLLGAGTLGCQVARMLMAWGVRKITIVDSGKVAMSNPLRQSLYTLEDCLNGGEFKAVAAANSLKRIHPAAEANGVVMAIPMPGHPFSPEEESSVLEDCKRLHDLVESHDAIFLLTDTRESRWLPTLLGSSANKITITAALGFEEFVVMRHGAGPFSKIPVSHVEAMKDLSIETESQPLTRKVDESRLGCYFCMDVVAPIDSTTNRTLDQQCTVTRPGLAPIASSLAVEVLVGMLHHPEGIFAEAELSDAPDHQKAEQPLGILPHQIRGSLFQFSQTTKIGYASSFCTACSPTVVLEYQRRGLDFILEAVNHPTYLEDLTGLTEMHKSSKSYDDLVYVSDENDDDIVVI